MIHRAIDVMAGERARAIRAGVSVQIVDPTDPRGQRGRATRGRPASPIVDPTDPRSGELEPLAGDREEDPTNAHPRDQAA